MNNREGSARTNVDEITRQRVLAALRDGCSVRAAATRCGISKTTVGKIAKAAGWEFDRSQVEQATKVRQVDMRSRRTRAAFSLLGEVERAVDLVQAQEAPRDFAFAAKAAADLSRAHAELARCDIGQAEEETTEEARSMIEALGHNLQRYVDEQDAEGA